MSDDLAIDFPSGCDDEQELYLRWLNFLRSAVLRNAVDLDDESARWRPAGALISVLGVINHLTHVEWRWITGYLLGEATGRSESEFSPGPELTLEAAKAAYLARGRATDEVIRATPLDTPCNADGATNLRWVLLHLINETARHAGHSDATRELFDGVTGE